MLDIVTFFVEAYLDEASDGQSALPDVASSDSYVMASWQRGIESFLVMVTGSLEVEIEFRVGDDVKAFFNGSANSFYENADGEKFDELGRHFNQMLMR